jgi:hypothetical protein
MSPFNAMNRVSDYYRRHGIKATVGRATVAAKRAFFAHRMVVFYCDLANLGSSPPNIDASVAVERLRNYADLSAPDLREMTSFWNPKQAHENIHERFGKGASLWIARCHDALAGYGWTLQGSTIEPYYFKLAPDDVHFFDFHVFPKYRGQAINPFLVTCILRSLVNECRGRAYIEAAEWNEAQLSSLRKTPFVQFGQVSSISVFGRRRVFWTPSLTGQGEEATKQSKSIRSVANSSE